MNSFSYSVIFLVLAVLPCHGIDNNKVQNAPMCQDNWNYYKEKCYKVYEDYETFDSALVTCRLQGGVIAYGKGKDEIDYLKRILGNYSNYGYWYGAEVNIYKSFDYNVYIPTPHVKSYWSESSSRRMFGYLIDIPKVASPQGSDSDQCISLHQDVWGYMSDVFMYYVDCDKKLPFVCGMRAGEVPKIIDDNHFNTSATDWFWISHPTDRKTQSEADKKCGRMSMTLASIRDIEQKNSIAWEIYRRLRKESPVNWDDPWWIGLNKKSGTLSWINGDVVNADVISWNNKPFSGKMKTILYDGTLMPSARSRFNPTAPFICMVDSSARGKYQCPPGWTRAGPSCYTMPVYTHKVSRSEAKRLCSKTDSTLLSLKDEQSREWFKNTEFAGTKHVWTSLNDLTPDGKYVWGDGSELKTENGVWALPLSSHGDTYYVYASRYYESSIYVGIWDGQGEYPGCQYKSPSGVCASQDWFYHESYCYFVKNSYISVKYSTMLHLCYQSLAPYNINVTIEPLILRDEVLIGKYEDVSFGLWVAKIHFENKIPMWPDKTPLNQSLFDFSVQPDKGTDNEPKHCVAVDPQGFMSTYYCEAKHGVVCEKKVPLTGDSPRYTGGKLFVFLSLFLSLLNGFHKHV